MQTQPDQPSGIDVTNAKSLWRNWDFQVLWASQTVSSTGQAVSSIGYPLLVLALTRSAVDAGFVVTINAAFRYAGGVLASPIVDRVDRRLVIVGCDLVRLAAAAAMVLLISLNRLDVVVAAILAGVDGCATSPSESAIQAAIVRVVPDEQLEQAVAQDAARADAAGLVGNGLAGVLFGLARVLPFAAQAAGYAASIVGALTLKSSLAVQRSAGPRETWLESLRVGVRWLVDRPSLLATWANLGLINFALLSADIVVIVLARRTGAGSSEAGIAVAMGSGAAIAGALIATRVIRLVGGTGAVLLAVWTCVLTLPLLALVRGFVGLGLVFAGMSLFIPSANVVLTSNLARRLDDDVRGRVWSFLGLLISGIGALGPVVSGALIEHLGRPGVLFLVIPAALTAISFSFVPALRRETAYTPDSNSAGE